MKVLVVTAMQKEMFYLLTSLGLNELDGGLRWKTSLDIGKPGELTYLKYLSSEDSYLFATIGIGAINAASFLTLLISKYAPTHVLLLGSCGMLCEGSAIGDLILPSRITQIGFGVQPSWGMPDEFILIKRGGCDIKYGPLVSVNSFVGKRDKKRIRKVTKSDYVDMESFAVVRVCYNMKTPVMVVRSVSDLLGGSLDDFYTNLKEAMYKIGEFMLKFDSPTSLVEHLEGFGTNGIK